MASSGYGQLVVVIPTRNRSDLAYNAIRSVLNQTDCDFRLLVSDNSTRAEELDQLARLCGEIADERLRYIRPPEPLVMSHHWSWALEQALADSRVSHVAFLTDRMLFKKHALRKLQKVISENPSKIISYNHDTVVDWEEPIHLKQEPWTGKVLEIETANLLQLSSRSVFPHCLPRMLNCATPRIVTEKIRATFGSVFSSLAPDFCFLYRSLAVEDSIVYFDQPLLIHYALQRSTGHTFGRGILSPDYKDWLRDNAPDALRYPKLPMPDILTGSNAILNEYVIVKEQTGSEKFPPIEMQPYLERLASEVEMFADPQLRESARKKLAVPKVEQNHRGPSVSFPRRVRNKIKWELGGPWAKNFWLLLARAVDVRPPADHRFGFKSVDEALAFDERFARPRSLTNHAYPFTSVTLSTIE